MGCDSGIANDEAMRALGLDLVRPQAPWLLR